jgi:PGF-CTERM protein
MTPSATASPTITPREPSTTDAVDDTVVTDVSFQSSRISSDEEAVIVVTVRNPQSTADSHLIELELFGQIVNSREIAVPPGGTRTVRFVHDIVAPGTYTARVDSETDSIRVVGTDGNATARPTATGTTFPGFGAVVVVVSVALAVLLFARRD